MEVGPARVPPEVAAPVVGPMVVGVPLVGHGMEEAKDLPVVEVLMEVDHKEVAHLEVVHLMDQEVVVDTALEVPEGVVLQLQMVD